MIRTARRLVTAVVAVGLLAFPTAAFAGLAEEGPPPECNEVVAPTGAGGEIIETIISDGVVEEEVTRDARAVLNADQTGAVGGFAPLPVSTDSDEAAVRAAVEAALAGRIPAGAGVSLLPPVTTSELTGTDVVTEEAFRFLCSADIEVTGNLSEYPSVVVSAGTLTVEITETTTETRHITETTTWPFDVLAPQLSSAGEISPPDFSTAIFDGTTLHIRLKCPARFKPRCLGTAAALTGRDRCRPGRRTAGRCKRGKPITSTAGAAQKPLKWKVVRLRVKPRHRAKVAEMAKRPDTKLLVVKQTIRAKRFKPGGRQTVFHIYKVRSAEK